MKTNATKSQSQRNTDDLPSSGLNADLARRALLTGVGLGALAITAPARAVLPRKLLVVYLRGGADALSLAPPIGADHEDLKAARERTHVQKPGTAPIAGRSVALPLVDEFGLHPGLSWLRSRYDDVDPQAGDLAVIHAVGTPSPSRSHFHMQAAMERAEWSGASMNDGWLARYLSATADPELPQPLRAVGIGNALPVSLRGGSESVSMRDLSELGLPSYSVDKTDLTAALRALNDGYAGAMDSGASRLERQATLMLDAMDSAATAAQADYAAHPEADYPNDRFGADLALAARLFKQDAMTGTEIVNVDLGGWDTHDATIGRVADRAELLDQGLAAFYRDMDARADDVTTIVMSEFGRRIKENNSRGADHGSGGCMFVIGRAIRGGVYARNWPGLIDRGQFDIGERGFRGDLLPMIDYRDVLADVLVGVLGLPAERLGEIFPAPEFIRDTLGIA